MKLNLGKVLPVSIVCLFILFASSYCHRVQKESKDYYESNSIEANENVIEPIEIKLEDGQTEQEECLNLVNLGEFRLTAYCSCDICCGWFAYNRPIDENGNEIVYGSIGERLVEGLSIAVDPSVIPYGTDVVINGHTYKAQDCGGAIDGNEIDVYFKNHQEALNFGIQYAEVHMIIN